METFEQPALTGYRQLSPEEAERMNAVKHLANQVGDMVAKMRNQADCDPRWVAIGTTELQQGFMALVRAIAKPTSF